MIKMNSLIGILDANKKKKFIISTSDATGLGINGVKYSRYYQDKEIHSVSHGGDYTDHIKSTIKSIEEDYIHMIVDINSIPERSFYKTYKTHTDVYIPLDTITKIEFV